MSEKVFQRGKFHSFLETDHRKRVAEDMRGAGSGYFRAVSNSLDNHLGGSNTYPEIFLGCKKPFQQSPHSVGHWNNPAFLSFPLATLPINDELMTLPIDVGGGQSAELVDSQTSIEQSPDDQLFLDGFTRGVESFDFITCERFSLEGCRAHTPHIPSHSFSNMFSCPRSSAVEKSTSDNGTSER